MESSTGICSRSRLTAAFSAGFEISIAFLASEPALSARDFHGEGFSWVDANDAARSLFSFLRFDETGGPLLVVANFTLETRTAHRFGVPEVVAGRRS